MSVKPFASCVAVIGSGPAGALAVAHLATEHMRQVLWFDDKSFEGSGLYQFRNVLANTKIEHIMNTIDKSMPFCWANAKPLRDAISALHHRSSTRVRLRLSYVSVRVRCTTTGWI